MERKKKGDGIYRSKKNKIKLTMELNDLISLSPNPGVVNGMGWGLYMKKDQGIS